MCARRSPVSGGPSGRIAIDHRGNLLITAGSMLSMHATTDPDHRIAHGGISLRRFQHDSIVAKLQKWCLRGLAASSRWTEDSGAMPGLAVRGVAAADEPSPRSTGHRAVVQRASRCAERDFSLFCSLPRRAAAGRQRGAQAGVADAHRDRGVWAHSTARHSTCARSQGAHVGRGQGAVA